MSSGKNFQPFTDEPVYSTKVNSSSNFCADSILIFHKGANESTKLSEHSKGVVVETNRTYRDVFWLFLFIIHLVITFGLLIAGIVAYKVLIRT